MYLQPTNIYYTSGGQRTPRGLFLLLLQLKDKDCGPDNTYAVVRYVALQQCGQFMMGRVNLCGRWHTVSGTYGNDGLAMDVDRLPHDAVPLPKVLYDAWNKGGGWNGAGAEGPALRFWARNNLCD